MAQDKTVEEVKKCRAEAEDKILTLLIELHKETGCLIDGVSVQSDVFSRVDDNSGMQTFDSFTINLKI